MNKWLMLVVLVLLVLTAAVGLRSLATPSWNGAITVSAPSYTMAPIGTPAPPLPPDN
jgi:hypothetical protein